MPSQTIRAVPPARPQEEGPRRSQLYGRNDISTKVLAYLVARAGGRVGEAGLAPGDVEATGPRGRRPYLATR
jgi:hypothetical protein